MSSALRQPVSHVSAIVMVALLLFACQGETPDTGTRLVDNPEGLAPMESFSLGTQNVTQEEAAAIERLAPPLRLAWAEVNHVGRVSGALDEQMHTWTHSRVGLMVDIIVRARPGDVEVVTRLRDAGMAISSILSAPALVLGSAPVSELAAIGGVDGVVSVEVARQMRLRTDQSITAGATDATGAAVASMNLTRGDNANGAGVVVGVIDTGIDYTHHDFFDADGNTRIESIWDQTDCADTNPPIDADGGSFGCVGDPDQEIAACGSEYTQHDITCTLAEGTDEPCTDAYRHVDQVDVEGHGTHVTSTAAGNGGGTDYIGVASASDIIMVKFDFENECQRNSSTAIIEGIRYIFDRAGDRPVVVNMSLGSDAGPHTGLTGEEIGINALTEAQPGRVVVVAAGNAARNYPDVNDVFGYPIHGHGTITEGETSQIALTVPASYEQGPLGENYIVMDLWYGQGEKTVPDVTVRVSTPPRGKVRNVYSFDPAPDPGWGSCYSDRFSGRICVFHSSEGVDATWDLPEGSFDHEIWVQIDDDGGVAPKSGDWLVELVSAETGGTVEREYDSWLLTSRSLGLVASTYGVVAADSVMTVGSPATASGVIAVAAYTTRSGWNDFEGTYQEYGLEGTTAGYYDLMPLNDLCFFSSRGPMRGIDVILKPEIAAPGGGIVAALSSATLLAEIAEPDYYYPGRILDIGDGAGHNAYAVLQGTSMATPHATGGVAVLLQRDPTLTTDDVREIFASSAATDDLASYGTDWGNGRFDIDAALEMIPCTADAHCNDGAACNGVETCDLVTGACLSGEEITTCSGATEDGCCPAGCDDVSDADCEASPLAEDCSTLGDEDGDGLADCDDPDCVDEPACVVTCDDIDGDGYEDAACGGTDCDDLDPEVNPDASEVCDDGVDNNCDGAIDEGCEGGGCVDVDGDGYEDATCGGTDCDDLNPEVNPDASEVCNDGVDNNCDGVAAVGLAAGEACSDNAECCSGSCHPRKGCR